MDKKLHYEFVNSQTGNVIAYLSLSVNMDEKERTGKLAKKKAELAVLNKLYIELIYWQYPDHAIR